MGLTCLSVCLSEEDNWTVVLASASGIGSFVKLIPLFHTKRCHLSPAAALLDLHGHFKKWSHSVECGFKKKRDRPDSGHVCVQACLRVCLFVVAFVDNQRAVAGWCLLVMLTLLWGVDLCHTSWYSTLNNPWWLWFCQMTKVFKLNSTLSSFRLFERAIVWLLTPLSCSLSHKWVCDCDTNGFGPLRRGFEKKNDDQHRMVKEKIDRIDMPPTPNFCKYTVSVRIWSVHDQSSHVDLAWLCLWLIDPLGDYTLSLPGILRGSLRELICLGSITIIPEATNQQSSCQYVHTVEDENKNSNRCCRRCCPECWKIIDQREALKNPGAPALDPTTNQFRFSLSLARSDVEQYSLPCQAVKKAERL